ncbi:hypothetical protein AVEN_133515-1 [Araneus ventricosus]|uniref:Reverse transcriptase domain-containing protein n=1 Tax=Araneus ventricosus TaxID=182803 RepID=A0A4Y2P1I6_ARAVE|nr:hypothetical protein AVEN_133515-1 [Araneus ventricosus]
MNSKTYFHRINRTFHTVDLAICSSSILARWNFTVDENLYNSDHFPIILKHFDNSVRIPRRPERFIFDKANWQLFTFYSKLNPDMVQIDDIDSATEAVTKHILQAAERSIPKTSGKFSKQWRPSWDEKYAEACKKLNKAWNYFRRCPTTNYFVAFKEAKAVARRIKRQNKRNTFQNYVSSIQNGTKSKVMWEKVRKLLGTYKMGHSVSFLNFNGQIISDIERIADTLGESFAKILSEETYAQEFIKYKTSERKKTLSFRSSSQEIYNSPFALHELKIALSKWHPTSPFPDRIHSSLLKNLSESSLRVLLKLFNRIWLEEFFPVTWRKAIVIPIPKPGKDPQIPTSYRPIALTSCLCKSGFRYGRGTIDNVLMLETAIRDAFVTKKRLVSVFFDMDKAYDRTWRYGILKDMYNMGFRGKLPIFIKKFFNDKNISSTHG